MKTQSIAAPHPSSAELEEFALGSLDAARAAIIEGHLYRCDRCADLVARVPGDEFVQQLRASMTPANSDANERQSKHGTLIAWLRSPIVWLPALTLLTCIMWLLFR